MLDTICVSAYISITVQQSVNCSAGMLRRCMKHKINKEAVIYDIVYNPINTHLINEAKRQKLEFVTGLDMFMEQARASFEIWFKIKPDISLNLINNIKKRISKA